MTPEARKDEDPTLLLLRKFRFLLPVGFVVFIVVPRGPSLLSGDVQQQLGAVLGIAWFSCLCWATWKMSRLPDPRFCRLLTVGSVAWFVTFVGFDAWTWTTDGFDPRDLPSLVVALSMVVVSAFAYRRASRAASVAQAGDAGRDIPD